MNTTNPTTTTTTTNTNTAEVVGSPMRSTNKDLAVALPSPAKLKNKKKKIVVGSDRTLTDDLNTNQPNFLWGMSRRTQTHANNVAGIELTEINLNMDNNSQEQKKQLDHGHGQEQEQDDTQDEQQPKATHILVASDKHSTCFSTLKDSMYRIIVGVMFLFVVFASGFVFVATSSISSTSPTSTLHWWWEVDFVGLIFQVAIVTAIGRCTINAVGGAHHTRSFILSIICAWAALLVVTQVAPSSWTTVDTNTKAKPVYRGDGCYLLGIGEKDELMPKIKDLCFDKSNNAFVQLIFNHSAVTDDNDEDIRKLVKGIEVFKNIDERNMQFLANTVFQGNQKIYKGLLHPTCIPIIVDSFCHDSFRKCRVADCSQLPAACLKEIKLSSFQTAVECIKKTCNNDGNNDAADCNAIDDASFARNTKEAGSRIAEFIYEGSSMGFSDMTGTIEYVFNRLTVPDEQAPASQNARGTSVSKENCNDWHIDLASSDTPTSENSSIISSTNITCDPSKSTFERTEENQLFDSRILLASVLLYFMSIVMAMGKNYHTLKFRCTPVRIASLLVVILMAALMHIGSIHLHNAATAKLQNSDSQSIRNAQLVWRGVYLFVSFLCFSGGLLLVAPASAAKSIKEDGSTDLKKGVEKKKEEERKEEEEKEKDKEKDKEETDLEKGVEKKKEEEEKEEKDETVELITSVGKGILIEERKDGFQVIELNWKLSNGTSAMMFRHKNTAAVCSLDQTKDSSISMCCSCCSCCNAFVLCILNSVTALKAFKAQFWDASGELFW